MDESDIQAITDHLRSIRCSDREIAEIIQRLRKHDEQTIRESVFDSIASGSFSLKAVIAEVREAESHSESLSQSP